jgi:ligand-binding SRPBCC domain-containing protein
MMISAAKFLRIVSRVCVVLAVQPRGRTPGLWQTGAMTVSFVCRTESSLPRERLFDLARSIDAHMDSQADAGERAVAGVTSGLIGEGQHVTWRARHFGVPLTMTSRVTSLHFPESFTDEQVKGPFKSFRHVHEFETSDAGSIMTDRIEFTAPFGFLGGLLERLVLRRYLERLIATRGLYLAGLVPPGPPA